MKNFILFLSILLTVNCSFAAGQYSSILDNIENSIYGFTYTTSDDLSRLSRIEESVYGQSKQNKSIQERVTDLKKDMAADLIGQEISPKEDTFAEEQDKYKEEHIAEVPPAGANVDYPSINELEKHIFKKEFKNQDLNSRLANLEKQALGKTFDNDPFSSRVERLQAKVKPKSFMNNSIAQSSNDYFDEQPVPLDKNYNLDSYHSPDFDYDEYNSRPKSPQRINLASVEKSIFKRVFNNESNDARLSRLESTMFGTTFNSDSEQERINRVASAYKAAKSASRYDSNKFSQNMGTAMQIGTIILMILACVL